MILKWPLIIIIKKISNNKQIMVQISELAIFNSPWMFDCSYLQQNIFKVAAAERARLVNEEFKTIRRHHHDGHVEIIHEQHHQEFRAHPHPEGHVEVIHLSKFPPYPQTPIQLQNIKQTKTQIMQLF